MYFSKNHKVLETIPEKRSQSLFQLIKGVFENENKRE
jgi:hypothetical protein